MAKNTNIQTPATTNKAAKVNLYADMRIALVKARNDGNKKAIDKQRIADLDVNSTSFNMWISEVDLLRVKVFDYVAKRKNARYGKDVSAEEVKAAREEIYPMWKKLLGFGEKGKYDSELRCDETDVEDLVGFVWEFIDTGRGTGEACVKKNVFRKKVESLLGCIIAKNEVLTEDERNILDKYQKAIHRQQQADETIKELDEKIKNFQLTLDGIPKNETMKPFRDYIENQIAAVQKDKDAANEKKSKAEATEKEYKTEAKKIQSKMKLAK